MAHIRERVMPSTMGCRLATRRSSPTLDALATLIRTTDTMSSRSGRQLYPLDRGVFASDPGNSPVATIQ